MTGIPLLHEDYRKLEPVSLLFDDPTTHTRTVMFHRQAFRYCTLPVGDYRFLAITKRLVGDY